MIKKVAIVVVVSILVVSWWIIGEKKAAKSVNPPVAVTNLIAFLEARPEVHSVRTFMHEGKLYIQVIGKTPVSLLNLPSGPPTYIFDKTGALVDWCRDLGDHPSFVRKWGGFRNATTIDREQAKKLVRGE